MRLSLFLPALTTLLTACIFEDRNAPTVELSQQTEYASTPLADQDAELLALRASCTIIAPTAVYERVAAEMVGLRNINPALRDYSVRSWWTNGGNLHS